MFGKIVKFKVINPIRYFLESKFMVFANNKKSLSPYRLLLVSDGLCYTSEQQFAPFYNSRSFLRSEHNFIFNHLLIEDALKLSSYEITKYDGIGIKFDFKTPSNFVIEKVKKFSKCKSKDCQLIYFDGDDDLGVVFPEVLSEVDIYLKKHIFKDRHQYENEFLGKSNLTDYCYNQYNIELNNHIIKKNAPISLKEIDKIILGWNIALDDKIRLIDETHHISPYSTKTIDIVCRAFTSDKNWIHHLRNPIVQKLESFAHKFNVSTSSQRVSQDEYNRELLQSKICISPFGYGEICWRDFEAIIFGNLLIKPDMSHAETWPNIFQPYKTYIPISWNFENLEEVCTYYLNNPEERCKIAENAYNVLSESLKPEIFASKLKSLLVKKRLENDQI